MGSRYLTDLANVLRAAGLAVQEESGWQTRARSSGGYDSGRPTHLMIHHTASNPSSDGQADVNYMCYSSSDRPIANLYVARTGRVWVMAAGATNTNGKGGPLDNVPADDMNRYAIGCEVANNGVGEPYPQAQQEAVAKLARAVADAYYIATAKISTHYLWAPQRKCDNTGPSRWCPPGTPGGCNGAGFWNMDALRADVAAGWPKPKPPEPPEPEEEDEMVDYLRLYRDGSRYVVFRRSGQTLVWMSRAAITADQASYKAAGHDAPKEVNPNTNVGDLISGYVLLGPPPDWGGGDIWPTPAMFAGHEPAKG